jgi:multiple sugar transport system permease protein
MRKKRIKSRLKKKEIRTAWLLLLPSLTGISIIILYPFLDAVRRSFYEAMSGKFVGFDNYITVFENGAFRLASKNTGRFILTCIPILLIFSLFLSILMVGQKRYGNFLKTSFLIPMAIPVASVVLLWRLFFENNGLVNKILSEMGGRTINWMHTSSAFYVLVFSYIWKNTGYDLVLWLAGLDGISFSLYEAASIDGAGGWNKFRYITLPGLLPTLFIISILSFINSFKVFREAYLIAGSYPDQSIYMLQHLFNNWFVNLDIQKMCSAAVLVAVVMIIFILIMYRIGKKGEEE